MRRTQVRLAGLASYAVVLGALAVVCLAGCQREAASATAVTNQVVDAGCGECQFGLSGSSCELAVRIGNEAYFVDGAKLDDFGDAHAADGMCSMTRKAKVTGAVRDGRFVASSFELLPNEAGAEAPAAK